MSGSIVEAGFPIFRIVAPAIPVRGMLRPHARHDLKSG
jgi:hypothetical protein